LVAETILIMYGFSLMFYIIKYKTFNLGDIDFKRSGYFISGIINIIFFLMIT
jgi:hypothetical protein